MKKLTWSNAISGRAAREAAAGCRQLGLSCLLLGAVQAGAQVTILSEGFEGAFPAAWATGDAEALNGTTVFWRDVNATYGGEGACSGNWKGHCAGTAYPFGSTEPNPVYPNYMRSFMQQAIDLSGVCSAQLTFCYKIPSIEPCCDSLQVYIDGTQVFFQNNAVAGWTAVTINLNQFIGAVHTLQFLFVSDVSVVGEGAYLDDILVTGNVVPPNDNFASAIPLGGGATGSIGGNNCNSSQEINEPNGRTRTVWYSWTPTSTGCTYFNTVGSAFDTVMGVYTGPGLGSLTTVGINDDALGKGLASRVEFHAIAGTTYWIQMDGFAAAQGNFVLNWGADVTPPFNDNFASAITLSGDSGSFAGSVCAATQEAGEPAFAGGTRTVWYNWTPTISGCVFFNTVGSSFDTVLCAFTGAAVGSLTQVGCNDDSLGKGLRSRVEFQAVAGTTYRIQASGFGGSEGDIVLNWGADTTPPPNDDFANAFFLFGAAGTIAGNVCNATLEAGEPVFAGGNNTMWYSWTPTTAGCVYFSTLGSTFDTVLCVFTGGPVNSLTQVRCNDDSSGKGLRSRVEFQSVPNTTYWIQVSGFNGGFGDTVLTWGADPTAPFNDNFANATFIGGDTGNIVGNNCNATSEVDEPPTAPGGGATIWYNWTAPDSRCYRFRTGGSSFDTVLSVLQGPALNSLFFVAPINDDAVGKGLQSRVEFIAFQGETYWVRVDGFGGAVGDIVLSWEAPPPPANDNFADAEIIAGTSGFVAGSNCNATQQPGEPNGRARTVWYSWTAPDSACVYFSTAGSPFDTWLCIYRGNTFNNLQQVGCNDDAPGKGFNSRVEFSAQAGQKYWIQMDGFAGLMGQFFLTWGPDTTPPSNDNFATPTFLFGDHGRITGNNCNATLEAGEPNLSVGGGLTVWHQWTAPTTASYAFGTRSSGFDTVMCVYRGGPTLGALISLGCNDDAIGKGLQSRVRFDAIAGTTYWIRLDGYQGAFGDIDMWWGCYPENFAINRSGPNAVISWTGAGYQLEATTTLQGPATVWTPIPGASPVSVPLSFANARFFRLLCP